MPELPEVETIKRDLNKFILNKKIKSLDILLPRIVKSSPEELRNILINNSFKKINRQGKLLIFALTDTPDRFLLIHLKMTGQLIYRSGNKLIAGGHSDSQDPKTSSQKYTRLIFKFVGGDELLFNDLRTFGAIKLANQEELKKICAQYGIEPLQKNFEFTALKKIINKRTINIKALLLNQALISGIGNIYADEILFASAVLPDRPANSLTDQEIKKIFDSTQDIIRLAIKNRGTTFNNYVDGRGKKGSFVKMLKVYGRGGEKCLKCKKTDLTKIKVAGRGTVYCSKCQK
jgi:formamidopyrimidine-DNA glycosylase